MAYPLPAPLPPLGKSRCRDCDLSMCSAWSRPCPQPHSSAGCLQGGTLCLGSFVGLWQPWSRPRHHPPCSEGKLCKSAFLLGGWNANSWLVCGAVQRWHVSDLRGDVHQGTVGNSLKEALPIDRLTDIVHSVPPGVSHSHQQELGGSCHADGPHAQCLRARHKPTVCDPVTGDIQDRTPEMGGGLVGTGLGLAFGMMVTV